MAIRARQHEIELEEAAVGEDTAIGEASAAE
jgi:hypothetical protein